MKTRLLLSCIIFLAASFSATAESRFVHPIRGNDEHPGTEAQPYRTVDRALRELEGRGGEIHLAPDAGFYRTPIVLRKGGTKETPLVIDGHGAIVNLGTDVTAGPWKKIDDGYLLEKEVRKHGRPYVSSVVFVNGLPIYTDHPHGRGPRAQHGGYVRFDEKERLILTFPEGLAPGNAIVVLTESADMISGVQGSSIENLVIRNLKVAFPANDGFNFHGACRNLRLENVTALFCGDQGISSHGTCEVDTVDSEVGFCGSQGAGIVDIMEAITTYENCRVHQNRNAGFQLQGKKHRIENCVSYGNPGRDFPKPSEIIEIVDPRDNGSVEADKTIPVYAGQKAAPISQVLEESDRMGRFLQYRPPLDPPVQPAPSSKPSVKP